MSLITCTPGGNNDNSYLTLADADKFFSDTLRGEKWLTTSAALREKALIQATAEIESLGGARKPYSSQRVRFAGVPVKTDITLQALHFPRTRDLNSASVYVIPEAVKQAVAEHAFDILSKHLDGQLIDIGGLREEGITSWSSDGVSFSVKADVRPGNMSQTVWQLIRPYLNQVSQVV